MKNQRVKSLVEIALMVATLAVISQISLPTVFGVPLTLQIFAVCLVGYLLNVKKSQLTIIIYISLGAIGIPVFANFCGGIFHLFSYTGGFIWGFIPLALFSSLPTKKLKIPMGILGTLICHFIGVLQYSLVGKISFFTAFLTISQPYLLKDTVLVVLAYFIAQAISKRLKTN